MNNKINIIIISLFILTFSCNDPNNEQIDYKDRVSEYGKIWGFLKYYHPNVSKGIINWDSVFITQIKRLPSAKTINDYNEEIFEILRTAGESAYYSDSIMTFSATQKTNYDFNWLEKSKILNKRNKTKLLYIRDYHNPTINYYAHIISSGDNPSFENENSYEEMAHPNKEYRLLALFRYWNVINYFFPYKYLTDEPWSIIPNQLIDIFNNAIDTLGYHLAIHELAAKINDGHSSVLNQYVYEKLGYYYLPVGFELVEGRTVISEIYHDSLSKANNLLLGDIITKINNTPVNYLRDSIRRYTSASNESVMNRKINIFLTMGKEGIMNLNIIRNGKEINVEANTYYEFYRTSHLKQNLKKWSVLENNIGYVNLGKVNPDDVSEIMTELKNTKAIVFDIRNYPNETLYEFCKFLLYEKRPFVKGFYPVIEYPGIFKFGNILFTGPENQNNDNYKGKIILIINNETQSHAEFTTMALQTIPGSVVVGNQTAGADGNCSFLSLPGDIIVQFTGIGIYYPDGTETQRIGIKPDFHVEKTIDQIKSGQDILLLKAIELANTN